MDEAFRQERLMMEIEKDDLVEINALHDSDHGKVGKVISFSDHLVVLEVDGEEKAFGRSVLRKRCQ